MKSSYIFAVLALASVAAQADAGNLLRGEVTNVRDGARLSSQINRFDWLHSTAPRQARSVGLLQLHL